MKHKMTFVLWLMAWASALAQQQSAIELPTMGCGNHVMMLGDLVPWAYECVAGIAPDPAKPGFKHIVMRPDFSIGVGQLFFQNQIAASRVFLRKAAIFRNAALNVLSG